jgi:DNA-binding MarR family transcriptional regulator
MGIEKDINQSQFRSEGHKATVNLIYTCNWLMEKLKTFLDPFDLTSQQYNILRILRGAKTPLSTMQIRSRMLDKMSDTSRIVDRLIIKDLVAKNVCPRDKRLVDVIITQKGLELLAEIDQYSDEHDAIFKNLSLEDQQQLNILLDKVRETADMPVPIEVA